MPARTSTPQPFYVAAPSDSTPPLGRLLLIAYHFPPSQAAGALRWEKFSHFAAERGWGMDVITLDPAALSSPDESRLHGLPGGTRVFGVPRRRLPADRLERALWRAKKFGQRFSLLNAGRGKPVGRIGRERKPCSSAGSLARVDVLNGVGGSRARRAFYAWREYARDAAWARGAADLGLGLVERTGHRCVISCGPPHMVHEGARCVATTARLPLVTDLRDPWSLVQRLPEHIASPVWYRLARRYERRMARDADLIVANTPEARDVLGDLYPEAANRMVAVFNGYDEDPIPLVERRERFTIAYAGNIYLDRDPRPLLRAAARVVKKHTLTPERFAIEMIGNVDRYGDVTLPEMAREEGVGDFLQIGPPQPHAEAMRFLARATLLIILPQDSDLAVPSKVFEYMRFRAWILALAAPRSATARVLRSTSAALVMPGDLRGIERVIDECYRRHLRGEVPGPIASDHEFSRRTQAQILLDQIERCLELDGVAESSSA